MRSFNIYVKAKRTFKIIASSFPKLTTLILNLNIKLKINSLLNGILKSYSLIKIKYLFSINEQLVKLKMKMQNVISPIKFNISYKFNSIVSEKQTINIYSKIIYNIISLVKVKFNNSSTISIISSPLVGQFRLLGEMDDFSLSEFDNLDLGTIDFKVNYVSE